MFGNVTPENAVSCAVRRRRAGVRAILSGTLLLLAAALLYWAVYAVTLNYKKKQRAAAIEKALQKKDLAQAAVLLDACCREYPLLTKDSRYPLWQNRLHELRSEQRSRQKIFKRKLADLKKLLAGNQLPAGVNPEFMLAETARFADSETELDELRSLQQHCATLERIALLKSAAGSVQQLKQLDQMIRQLADLRRNHQYRQYRAAAEHCRQLLEKEIMRCRNMPEIAALTAQLRSKLTAETDSGKASEQRFLQESAAFEDFVRNVIPDEFKQQCEAFLQQYPAGIFSGQVRTLQQNFNLLAAYNNQKYIRQLQKMAQQLQAAENCWRQEIQKIIASELHEQHFALTVKLTSGEYLLMETYEKCTFSPPGKDGIVSIKIPCLDGRTAIGRFRADAVGTIELGGKILHGQAVNTALSGDLPPARWQELLLQLQADTKSGKTAADFAGYMLKTQTGILKQLPLLPIKISRKLQAALRKSSQMPEKSWKNFIFQRKFFTFCSLNMPVFAGLAQPDKTGKLRFFPADDLPENGICFLLVQQAGKLKFHAVNARRKLPQQFKTGTVYPAAVIPNNTNWQKAAAVFRAEAAKEKLPMPPLPDFLQ